MLVLNGHLLAQGCAQCLDSTRATPPQVQAAYRLGIYLLAGFALCLFTAGVVLLSLLRRQEQPSKRSHTSDPSAS